MAARLANRIGRGIALMIGVNDAIRATVTTDSKPLDRAAITQNLSQILRQAKQYGPVLVNEPTPVSDAVVRSNGGTGEVSVLRVFGPMGADVRHLTLALTGCLS